MQTELERALGYEYRDRELLRMALSHTSYANEIYKDAFQSYERLEFLGDSILGFVTADYLYHKFPTSWRGNSPASVRSWSAKRISHWSRRSCRWATICCWETERSRPAAASVRASRRTWSRR